MKTRRKATPVKIHLAVDGSENSFAAAKLINDLALPAGSEVTALGVLTPRQTPRKHLLLAALDEVQQLIAREGIDVKTGLLHGKPAIALKEYDAVHPPDLLILGAKGLRSTVGILLGGVAQHVVEHAQKPALIVRTPYNGLRRVLLAVDGSKYSEHALRILKRFPFLAGGELHVIHVLPPPPDEERYMPLHVVGRGRVAPAISQEVRQAIAAQVESEKQEGQKLLDNVVESLKSVGIGATPFLASGDAATEIINYAKANEIDLIVAGGRGLSAVKGWLLGSVSRKLVHYAPCSVLIEKGV